MSGHNVLYSQVIFMCWLDWAARVGWDADAEPHAAAKPTATIVAAKITSKR
ncbi:MAG: hypothetical protein ACJ74U_02590 [Jatrophihabitantaceae bacterium]